MTIRKGSVFHPGALVGRLSWWLRVKEFTVNAGAADDVGSLPGWEDPWRRAWQPTLALLPGESPWTGEPGRISS